MKKILLIHGLLHTTTVYDSLKSKLSDYEVVLWKFDGLDNDINCTTDDLIKQLQEHLNNNEYDLIVAHSVGCNILLRVLNKRINFKVLLLNPVYQNYRLYLKLIIPVLSFGLYLSKRIYIKNTNSKFIKILALFTCNNMSLIDETITSGLSVCNINSCSSIIRDSMIRYNVDCNNISVVYSRYDRLLKTPTKLIDSVDCDCYELLCGHFSFVEEEKSVIWIIQKIINS